MELATAAFSKRDIWIFRLFRLPPEVLSQSTLLALRHPGIDPLLDFRPEPGHPVVSQSNATREPAPLLEPEDVLAAGCRALRSGEVFLLAPSTASFDGRYLGITKVEQIIGTANR